MSTGNYVYVFFQFNVSILTFLWLKDPREELKISQNVYFYTHL